MFDRILIANRGEIACRIIRTARRMGIGTVAVFSDADAAALHVRMADRAVNIGPPEAAASYLDGEAIIAAALQQGAQAIHPGYGFLSENPDFVEAVAAADLAFIGPSASSIRAMGLKDAAKALMEQAGVPVVPGYHGDAQDTVVLATKANEIGYPVLIKARAGGGGKGMRKVDRAADFRDALAGARREAKAAFGDERVLVEKFIERPRHIEVQVFGDSHGNVVHLFERDCSLQRRHQKVIEEAPAPGMPDDVRRAMTDAAVRAAQAIDYVGAGTVEFIVDAAGGLRSDGFWFMEMNTRLQVEHPVTECVTGLDLVEWQLRVAAGEPLPLTQDRIVLSGHAFEARIYAEDAGRGFLPATGTLHHVEFPADARIDSGVTQGDVIHPYYDPMIAKLVVRGRSREEALERLADALARTRIAGSVTNTALLLGLARNAEFAAGKVDTDLIARALPSLLAKGETAGWIRAAAALAALGLSGDNPRSGGPFDRMGAWALWNPPRSYVDLRHAGDAWTAAVEPAGGGRWRVASPEGETVLSLAGRDSATMEAATPDGRFPLALVLWPGHVTVFAEGAAHEFAIADPFDMVAEEGAGADHVAAPMPGLVKIVHVAVGDSVAAGTPLLVLEAMKMEHTLAAPRDGVVAEIRAQQGAQVADGAVLLTFREAAGRGAA